MKDQYAVQVAVGYPGWSGHEEGIDMFTIDNLSIVDAANQLIHHVDCIKDGINFQVPGDEGNYVEIADGDSIWLSVFRGDELIAGGQSPDGCMFFGEGFSDRENFKTEKSIEKFYNHSSKPGASMFTLAIERAGEKIRAKLDSI